MTRVEFQLSEVEFQEAVLGRPPTAQRYLAGLLVLVGAAMTGVMVLTYVLGRPQPGVSAATAMELMRLDRSTAPWADRAARVARVAAPAVAWLLLIFLPALLAPLLPPPAPWRPPGKGGWRRKAQSYATIAVTFGALATLWLHRTPYELALVMAPTAAVLAMLGLAVLLQQAFAARRNWRAQPHLHRPTTMETSPGGDRLVFEHAAARQDYAWAAFAGYKETANLLLLYLSPLSLWIVPKRAFADVVALGRFRMALAERVPEGTFLAQTEGFAVLPMATAAAEPPPIPVAAAAVPAVPAIPLAGTPPNPRSAAPDDGTSPRGGQDGPDRATGPESHP